MSLLDGALAALAAPSRRRIVETLRSPVSMRDLVAQTGLTRQAVQQHLAVLSRAGLVRRDEVHGRHVYVLDARGIYAVRLGLGGLAANVPHAAQPTVVVPTDGARAHRQPLGLWHLRSDGVQWLPLEGGPSWVLGRGERFDVRLDDPSVSTAHAILQIDETGWSVTDLRSTNGTFVNERRVEPGPRVGVVPGDLLRLGRCVILHAR